MTENVGVRQERLETLARWWKDLNQEDLEKLARKVDLLNGESVRNADSPARM